MNVTFNKPNNINFKGHKNKQPENVQSLINKDRLVDSFVKMAKIDSGSNEELSEVQTPSTEGQKVMARMLEAELNELGLKDVNIDEHFIVTATMDSNLSKEAPIVGLLAHVDTSPDAPTKDVMPILHEYKGGDIELTSDVKIYEKDLKSYIGQKIITSNGTTLLGADDKAGIAEILEALRVFKEHPELKRPKIRIAFTPDEEVGSGVEKFDIKRFGADLAYTVDGYYGVPHVIENESFNAFNPEIIIKGKNTHCGDAKAGGMINSIKVANWIISKFPANQAPETTEKKQGYFHVDELKGTVSETKVKMLVRDHSIDNAQKRIAYISEIIRKAQDKFKCEIEFKENPGYKNMKEKIDEFPEVMKYTKLGIKRTGLTPEVKPIRGGTDGSHLSLNGLLTPNIGTGGHNFHSKNEFLSVEEMVKCTENIINILSVWAEKASKVMPKIISRR